MRKTKQENKQQQQIRFNLQCGLSGAEQERLQVSREQEALTPGPQGCGAEPRPPAREVVVTPQAASGRKARR